MIEFLVNTPSISIVYGYYFKVSHLGKQSHLKKYRLLHILINLKFNGNNEEVINNKWKNNTEFTYNSVLFCFKYV